MLYACIFILQIVSGLPIICSYIISLEEFYSVGYEYNLMYGIYFLAKIILRNYHS